MDSKRCWYIHTRVYHLSGRVNRIGGKSVELNKAQLKYLRKLSHIEKPLFQLGKLGLTDVFVEQIDAALEKRELIKFVILQNSDENLEEVSSEIAKRTNATIVQTIGNKAILYREALKEKHQKISQEVHNLV